jgi:transposase
MVTARELPDTLEAAHERIAELHSRNSELESTVDRLQHQIDQFLRHRFGQRSEKIDPEQYKLAFQELEARHPSEENDAGDEIEIQGHKRRRKGHGRTRFSEDLPRRRAVVEPEDTTCPCCQKPMKRIGEETSEQIDYKPATLEVLETVRPKYACPDCKEGVTCAPPPKSPIPKSKATAATLAHVAVSKYVDHRVPRRHAQQPEGRRSKLCCMEDEGRSLGIGVQARVPNHLELRGSRVRVVSVEGKGAARPRQVGSKKTSGSEPLMTCREVSTRRRNRAGWLARDESRGSLSTDWTASGMKVA